MDKYRGLARMGLVVNAPYLGDWPDKIGRFVLNFGAIELVSYKTLLLLEDSDEAFLSSVGQPFARRTDRIVELLGETPDLADAAREQAIALWTEAREIAKWRNRIAHNPVLPTWKPGSDAEREPPDLLGIPDVAQLKAGVISDSIQIGLLDRMVNDLVTLGQALHSVASQLAGPQE